MGGLPQPDRNNEMVMSRVRSPFKSASQAGLAFACPRTLTVVSNDSGGNEHKRWKCSSAARERVGLYLAECATAKNYQQGQHLVCTLLVSR